MIIEETIVEVLLLHPDRDSSPRWEGLENVGLKAFCPDDVDVDLFDVFFEAHARYLDNLMGDSVAVVEFKSGWSNPVVLCTSVPNALTAIWAFVQDELVEKTGGACVLVEVSLHMPTRKVTFIPAVEEASHV